MLGRRNEFASPKANPLTLGKFGILEKITGFGVLVGIVSNRPAAQNHPAIKIPPGLVVKNRKFPAISVTAQNSNCYIAVQKALQEFRANIPAIIIQATLVESQLSAFTRINSRQPVAAFPNANGIAINHINISGMDGKNIRRAQSSVFKNTEGQN